MPGYLTQQSRVQISGVADLHIRALLDRQQFADPLGVALRLGISSATWPLFGMLWPSGAELAALLAQRPVRAGERMLEIGCGLALASLVGHRRGADITASDCHPLAGPFLLENLRLNHLPPMKYRHGHWAAAHAQQALPGSPGVPAVLAVAGSFDLIIGSDVLYERDEHADLAGFIGRHAADNAEIWIVDPNRSNRPAFHRQMAGLGFALHERLLQRRLEPTGAPAYRGRLLTYRRVLAPCAPPPPPSPSPQSQPHPHPQPPLL